MTTETPIASDLMATSLVTVPPGMPVTAVARLLGQRSISSVPVLDAAGKLLGLVTEADLLRRIAGAEDGTRSWLGRLLRNDDADALNYARTHGRTAGDIMTTELVTAAPGDTVAHCAKLMEERRVKRLPVVSAEGRLLGMLSRADLLVAAMQPPAGISAAGQGADDSIRAALRQEIRKEGWADTVFISSEVKDGVVTFHGFVQTEGVRRGLCVLASRIEGVREVVDQMELAPPFVPGAFI